MSMIQPLIDELKQEQVATRKVLEAIPEDRLDYSPGDKALTMGQLAMHIAGIPASVAAMVQRDTMDVRDFPQDWPTAMTKAEVLAKFDESEAAVYDLLASIDDERARAKWAFVAGETELWALPRIGAVRGVLISHLIHHRGQLTAYLRSVGATVPAVYGMSADDNPFAELMSGAAG